MRFTGKALVAFHVSPQLFGGYLDNQVSQNQDVSLISIRTDLPEEAADSQLMR